MTTDDAFGAFDCTEDGVIWDRLKSMLIAVLAAKTAHTADSAKPVVRTAR
ncbi:MAG TPA: hypothetical protein VF020_02750 [Chthoniobacterales bacterium]